MNKEEFIKKYENKAVHCDTEEKANEFLTLADSFGFKWWFLGSSLLSHNNWKHYKEITCYFIKYDEITFGCIQYEKQENYERIKFKSQKKKPKFTEDEKVILRNIPEGYNWIARDRNDIVFWYKNKPYKLLNASWRGHDCLLNPFDNLFQSIQWEDKEPCEFRKFLDE
ncbi:MAG: hypothetical protein PHX62_09445 [Bacilli bacterium]|nr:hypothetical protein [Bacilli bacterium]